MISTEYANAYTEILEIIKFIPDSDYEKIPEGYIQVFQKHSNTNYDFKYNPKKSLDEQNVSKMTKEIIALLYRDFWAGSERKKKILQYQESKRLQIEMAKYEKHNPNSIFKNPEEIQDSKKEVSIAYHKENILIRLFNFIKNIFK